MKMKPTIKVVFAVASIALGFWLFFYAALIKPTAPVTNVRRYDAVLTKLKQADPGTSHFPDSIPATAHDATFFYRPPFLQGAALLRLRLTLREPEIAEIDRRMREKHSPINRDELRDLAPDGVPRKGVQSADVSTFEPFPDDCVSFLTAPDIETAKKNRNHPHNSGISISPSRNEVIYWLN
jgi:hypothetical protein